MVENRIQRKVVQMAVFVSSMVVEIYEIFNVVMSSDVLNVAFGTQDGHAYHLIADCRDKRLDLGAILR